MRDENKGPGMVHVEPGVGWGPEPGGEERDLSIAVVAVRRHADLSRVLVGPTTATHQPDDGGHPVMTIEQARRVGSAILRAADDAEGQLPAGVLSEEAIADIEQDARFDSQRVGARPRVAGVLAERWRPLRVARRLVRDQVWRRGASRRVWFAGSSRA